MKKTRVLFFAEAVTLAHVARPVALAKSLDPEVCDVHFAHCPRYRPLLGDMSFTEHHIKSISPQQFMGALDKGSVLYDLSTLKRYVEEDLQLIAAVKPDIVVGDFRLSLAVSAELAGTPYISLSNACWSPYTRQHYTVPELPLSRTLGPVLGQWVFELGRPVVFASHCIPMFRLRRDYGLKSLGFNLNEVYTHGDYTLYADIPGLYQMPDLPENHRLIGPVTWSPDLPLPAWWQTLPKEHPFIYVTLGSSGQAGLLPEVLSALAQLPVTALVSTAGAEFPREIPQNVFVEKYLPGEAAVERSSLVICNGGSPTTHQALAAGVPVLGLAGNLDQYLNMATIERAGAGRLLRSGSCDSAVLVEAVPQLLIDPVARKVAGDLSKRIRDCDFAGEFYRIINEISLKSDFETQPA